MQLMEDKYNVLAWVQRCLKKTYSHQESLYLPFNPTQLPARIHGHSHCRTPRPVFFLSWEPTKASQLDGDVKIQ